MNPADKSDPTVLVHRQWLETHLKSRVFLTWTDNRTSMVSVSRHPATGYQLRLHHMFQVAPEGVWYALVQYILNKNHTAKEALRTYINQRQDLIRQAPSSHRTPSVSDHRETMSISMRSIIISISNISTIVFRQVSRGCE
ncbi:hypothetical protein C2W62_11330 [Candidatus Entotheonella serta]|nr:hypothetical protein C2W62_11330 [Candidatus Entotheonella serta]